MLPPLLSLTLQSTLIDYLRTTFRLRSPALDAALFSFLQHPTRGMFRGPYLDIRLPFRPTPATTSIPLTITPAFPPHAHQLRAWQRLSSSSQTPSSTLVTTGTGSGKTECFLYPILDHCHRHIGTPGIKAILLYPMNALASDQAERLAGILHSDPRLKNKVRAGLYVGDTPTNPQSASTATRLADDRDALRQSPPDILLTNYRMLDFLLMRPDDGRLWQNNSPETLRYLVLDELHTYDGAQGSDVACLIRRLRRRLQIPAEHLCCVGTSATIGSGSPDSRRLLVDFARDVFGTPFDDAALVTEDRLTVDEFFADVPAVEDPPIVLPPHDPAHDPLDPTSFKQHGVLDPAAYLDAQAQIWLGHDARDPERVARSLQHHGLLRDLLVILARKTNSPPTFDEIAAVFADDEDALYETNLAALPTARRVLALHSFVALVCHARAPEQRPFLHVQVQFWVRELRHLLRKVSTGPVELRWRDESVVEPESKWLPMVHCRECGFDGYGAVLREGETKLLDDDRQIGEAYLRRLRRARFLVLGDDAQRPMTSAAPGATPEQLELPSYLCKRCLRYSPGKETCGTTDCPGKDIPARAHVKLSDKNDFVEECPSCGASDGLSMLGSRAASLSSVAVSHLFLSPYNDDAKLLAFTDSVQDASHRAGFFAGRTFRFGLRTAIQATLEDSAGPIPLTQFVDRLFDRWQAPVGSAEDRPGRLELRKFVATFTPPDLREHPDYEKFAQTPMTEAPPAAARDRVLDMLRARLGWEVTREYGFGVVVGRSLEATGCSTLALDEAAIAHAGERLAAQVVEHRPITTREAPSAATATHFLEGLLHRQRRRGGIEHPLIKTYAESGERYLLSKRHNAILSPPGRTPPRFFLLGTQHPVFDPLYSKPASPNWARDWTARALQCETRDGGIDDVLRRAVALLVEVGVFVHHDAGKEPTAGLAPERLAVTRDVGHAHCPRCGVEVLLPTSTALRWGGQRCPGFRCAGVLVSGRAERRAPAATYYRDLYKSGRIERIFATEHTGLLERDDREEVERLFKSTGAERPPDAPNLLACTPTLEMGIDIGDLGAAMLCSVPPLASNYLQRVGRAGRKTGNALVLTFATDRPHDQYFYAQPREMLAGDVSPPGCFLDAPDMLLRQLVAYAMDRWALADDDPSHRVPRDVGTVLGAAGKDGFPGCFYRFVEEHRETLLAEFLEMFTADARPPTVAVIREFAAAGRIEGVVRDAFEAVRTERDDYRKRVAELKARREQIELEPALAVGVSADPAERLQQELAELEDARRSFGRIMTALVAKYPLGVLTDYGALPNYAFPETGVTLKSVLRGLAKREGPVEGGAPAKAGKRKGPKHETNEYVRPASAALREFAPFNTFYAEGHRVVVGQVDLGSGGTDLTEAWRFCPSCNHVDVKAKAEQEPDAACPACGHAGWSDAGQKRKVVFFQRAMSMTNLLESISDDATEERKQERYRTMQLIEVPDTPPEGHTAWLAETERTTFGYELLSGVVLRELNFGLRGTMGLTFPVAGQSWVQEGFKVCRHCGKVQDPRSNRVEHAGYCRVRQAKVKPAFEEIYLYRTIRSEALRILLPVSESSDLAQSLPSFRAALHLGLRKRFHGYPLHLKITDASEPVDAQGTARRRFALVYDAVPGGTGYLADLARPGVIFEVLRLGLTAMRACPCRNTDPVRDGCYRCLYAYQEQRELANLSRTRAEQLFAQILEVEAKLQPAATLNKANIDQVLESELEERFVQTLARWTDGKEGWRWESDVPYEFGRCYRIVAPERTWRLEPQRDVGLKDGVAIASRPDFLLRCLDDDAVRPIAIFCDGLRYHACPDKPQGRIADDLRKRKALIDSGKFWVWTITWKDLPAPGDKAESVVSLFDKLDAKQRGMAAAKLPDGDEPEIVEASGMGQLQKWIERPSAARWTGTALASGVGLLALKQPVAVAAIQAVRSALETAPVAVEPEPLPPGEGAVGIYGAHRGHPYARLLATIDAPSLKVSRFGSLQFLLRIFDEYPARHDAEFEASWRAFFHAWNLLQFHPSTDVVSSEWLAAEGAAIEPPDAGPVTPAKRRTQEVAIVQDDGPPLSADYLALRSEFEELRMLVPLLAAAGLPAPEEFPGVGSPTIEVESIVAWPEYRIAVALELGDDDLRAWSAHGWTAFTPEQSDAIVAAVAAARDAKG